MKKDSSRSRSQLGVVMVPLLCCRPKLATCRIMLSVWGVIMLVLLLQRALGFPVENIPFLEADVFDDPEPPKKLYGLYEQVSYNCFIATAFYILLHGFSLCQVRLNKRKEYMVR